MGLKKWQAECTKSTKVDIEVSKWHMLKVRNGQIIFQYFSKNISSIQFSYFILMLGMITPCYNEQSTKIWSYLDSDP